MSILTIAGLVYSSRSFQSLTLLYPKDGGSLHVSSSPRKNAASNQAVATYSCRAACAPLAAGHPLIATRTLPQGIDMLGCAESVPLRKSNAAVTD